MENSLNEAWERIKIVIEVSGTGNVHAFSIHIGLNRAEVLYRIQRGKNGVSRALAQRIHAYFPQFSVTWLMSGENFDGYLQFQVQNNWVKIPCYKYIGLQKTEQSFLMQKPPERSGSNI